MKKRMNRKIKNLALYLSGVIVVTIAAHVAFAEPCYGLATTTPFWRQILAWFIVWSAIELHRIIQHKRSGL